MESPNQYNNLLPTVILTNIAVDDLESRIASQLHEGVIYTITAGPVAMGNTGL